MSKEKEKEKLETTQWPFVMQIASSEQLFFFINGSVQSKANIEPTWPLWWLSFTFLRSFHFFLPPLSTLIKRSKQIEKERKKRNAKIWKKTANLVLVCVYLNEWMEEQLTKRRQSFFFFSKQNCLHKRTTTTNKSGGKFITTALSYLSSFSDIKDSNSH